MPFTCKVGDSFYLSDEHRRHRWVILTKPNSAGCVVIINFTDVTNTGCPVVFRPGDHNPFTKRTTIFPQKARLVLESKLKALRVVDYAYFNEQQVEKIVEGAIDSIYTPLEIVTELKSQYPKFS
jgi:hypothetical protein